MPEVISKHPEITIKVLEGAGARCGSQFQPKILKNCPPERFCSLPTGEICVYGVPEIPQMTQISREDLLQVVAEGALPTRVTPADEPRVTPKEPLSFDMTGIIVAIFVGVFLGLLIGKKFLRK